MQFFEDAGGAFTKFGQILALRIDVIPKEQAFKMMDLFDNVKPFPYLQVVEIFKRELGSSPDEIFPVFEKVPFASASFGQVHAAKLKDGTVLAVKVQRPGIYDTVKADLFLIDMGVGVLSLFFKIDGLSWSEFITEFKRWTLDELDYQIEAQHASQIYQAVKNSRHAIVPKTYPHYSTSKILVQDYLDGVPLSRIMKEMRAGRLDIQGAFNRGLDIHTALINLVHEITRQYLCDECYHADPHPGNILILPNGKVGFIDFGIVGIPAPNRAAFRGFLKAYSHAKIEEVGYHFMQFAGEDLERMINGIIPPTINKNYFDEITKVLAKDFELKLKKQIMAFSVDLADMKIDYTVMLVQILKMVNKYKIKLPAQVAAILRGLSIIGFMAKEMDKSFKLTTILISFFDLYPDDTFPTIDIVAKPNRKMSREEAIERTQNWLMYLFETEPELYSVINNSIDTFITDHV